MPPLCLRCAHSPCTCIRPAPAPGSSDVNILSEPGHGMIIGPDDALFVGREGVPQPARYDPPGPFGIEPQPDALMPPTQGDSDSAAPATSRKHRNSHKHRLLQQRCLQIHCIFPCWHQKRPEHCSNWPFALFFAGQQQQQQQTNEKHRSNTTQSTTRTH